jgi:hypothetical protein
MDHGQVDEWMVRLRRAVEAGYFKTEAALGEQEPFPWQNKTCTDCPFWLETHWCQVHGADREPDAHTCGYFDPCSHTAARHIIHERELLAQRRYWDWFSEGR